MAGHSKWAQIKRKKAVADARKGQLFTKLAREITAAARAGGGDPAANVTLRLLIEKAKAANMPKENIERAIQRGTGELKGEELEELYYEGYGPGGIALMLHVLTDNRNRAVADIRRIFNRQGGSLGESGCVAWMFDKKGVITIEANGQDPEELALLAIDAGAEDVEIDDNLVQVYTAPERLAQVKENLEKQAVSIETAELAMVPKSRMELDEHQTIQAMKLIEALEELEDVQDVYSNLEISDTVMAKYESE